MKQMVIIMEGPDGCGKTEIGKAVAKYYGIPYFKVDSERDNWRNGRFKEALEFDQTYISQFLEQTGHSCVIDRAWPSEYVYSWVFQRETNLDVLRKVDERFANMGTFVVVCKRNNYDNVKDELVDSWYLQNIDEVYDEFINWTACDTVTLFVDDLDEDIDKELAVVVSAMNKKRWTI